MFKTSSDCKIMPVYYDISFKHLFGTEENIRFTKYLLSLLFGYSEEELKDIKFIRTKLNPDNIKGKKYETDILLYLNNEKVINLEVYYKPSAKSYRKSQMYVYKLLLKKHRSSEDYDTVPKVIQYNFIKKGIPRCDDMTLFGVTDRLNNKHAPNELFDIYDINVDTEKKKMSRKQKNLIEFIEAETEDDMKKIAKKDEVIRDMYEELCRFCQSDEFPIEGYSKEDLIRDSGREEGKQETVIEMLKDSMPVDKISKYTKISIEDIQKIKNDIIK